MTGLLVSVRSAAEAAAALPHVDLLDVKEPARGALGAADFKVISAVLRLASGQVPVSAALGELLELPDGWRTGLPPDLRFAKLGLAGCAARPAWPTIWGHALSQLPPGVVPVAVAYADWSTCDAPAPAEVLCHGRQLGCGALLLDTLDKSGGGLLDRMPPAEAERLLADARECGLLTVVAGSLTVTSMATVLPWQPDFIAVRGAACRGQRTTEIDGGRVAELARRVNAHACPS